MKRFLFFIMLFLGAFELIAQQGVQRGVVKLKLKPSIEQTVRCAVQQQNAVSIVQMGIQKMDVVNTRYTATSMQPVFNIGGPFEERQRRYGLHLWYEVHIDTTADMAAAVADYLASGAVEVASPAYRILRTAMPSVPVVQQAATLTPNDTYFPRQWNLNNTGQPASLAVAGVDIRMPAAWAEETGKPGIIVAVIDGGIDHSHTDLHDNMWPGIGYNFARNMASYTFDNHGTHVAGIVAARSANSEGVAGIAGGWGAEPGVQLMSCAIFDGHYVASGAGIARAFQYAADNGALIAQNSWGYDEAGAYDPEVRVAINYFIDNAGKDNNGQPLPGTLMTGGIVFFAGGNNSSSYTNWYPAMFPEVWAVAAVGPTGKRAWYSNYSDSIDITAPGGDWLLKKPEGGIYSTVNVASGSYAWLEGTSMACPHVSGIAALVLSKFGSGTYTPALLRRRLLESVNPLPNEPLYAQGKMGAGLIDASKAVADDIVFVQSVQVAPATIKLVVGDTASLAAIVSPSDATNKSVGWTSNYQSIVSVDAAGKLTAKAAGEANVTVTTADGGFKAVCTVTVYAEAKVPQGFSPNDDGVNDYFEIVMDSRDTYSLKVFDRSGQFYYQTDDYRNDWNGLANSGHSKGQKIPAGTYFYMLTAHNSGHVQSGYVVIRY